MTQTHTDRLARQPTKKHTAQTTHNQPRVRATRTRALARATATATATVPTAATGKLNTQAAAIKVVAVATVDGLIRIAVVWESERRNMQALTRHVQCIYHVATSNTCTHRQTR